MSETNEFIENYLDPIYEIPGCVIKKIRAMKMNTPEHKEVCKTLEKLNIKYEYPGWRGEIVGHFVIPSLQLVIWLPCSTADILNSRVKKYVDSWKKFNFEVVYARPNHVSKSFNDGKLGENIEDLIKVIKKKREKNKK